MAYGANGLNQLSTVAGVTMSYDGKGNLSNDGAKTYAYGYDNKMGSATGVSLTYDALRRLWQAVPSGQVGTQFLYDADEIIAEYSGATLLRRYVRGPGDDEALVWYEGSGTTDRRWLVADATSTATNIYDQCGESGEFCHRRPQTFESKAGRPLIAL